ncbi:hypothetical protein BD770DRAFT_384469 [Pilaira anomala]|nr:hypothetical protein BD770DRAFT_384469 [Pilaira anomala]
MSYRFFLLSESMKFFVFVKFIKNVLRRATVSEILCHPCAGAMLIFSVMFQFYWVLVPKN